MAFHRLSARIARLVRHAYPLMLDVTDRLVVIIGGGVVACRKAKGLIEAEARRLRVVSPKLVTEFPEGIEWVRESYREEHLNGAELVFAATDDVEVNDRVVSDARRRGMLVNRADAGDENPGDFATPAKWSEGPVVLTVSAGGNPALAVMSRVGVNKHWVEQWMKMAKAMEGMRTTVVGE